MFIRNSGQIVNVPRRSRVRYSAVLRMGSRLADRPGPRRITFVTNPDECNLACRMCREHSPFAARRRQERRPRRLPFELVERVLTERAGSRLREVIPSTKGEPLLWGGLERLIELCARLGLSLNVTTNGTFPRRGGAGWAELLVPVARDVKLSWNGAMVDTAAQIMGGLSPERALAEARAFLRARDARRATGAHACKVSFQVTAQEANVAELPQLVRLAAALGVERVKVNQLQVHFAELAGEDLRRAPSSRARWNAAVEAMRAAAQERPLPSGQPVALENVEPWPEAAEPTFGPCPFLGREAWVTADGWFAPCPAPAGQEGALGDFGSLRDRTMGSIWESDRYRALVAGYETNRECHRCPMRRVGGV